MWWLVAVDVGQLTAHVERKERFGANKVDDSQRVVTGEHGIDVRSDGVGHDGENANDFACYLALYFANAVVGLHDFLRLDKHRFSACALVVYDAFHLAFVHGRHGQHEAP